MFEKIQKIADELMGKIQEIDDGERSSSDDAHDESVSVDFLLDDFPMNDE